ncbi:MAG: 50S ribosomal protein L13 [Actinomycetia bacterium]|nr:50S ribosomal protein L13 [Actinomycetes bacterium]
MSTYYAKPGEVPQEWVLIDATDQALGRVASLAAQILKGKLKPQYTPHVDTGDFVVIVNAAKIKVTGAKAKGGASGKIYYHHTGFIGGLKQESFEVAMQRHPERVVERAVRGMLPKTTLGRAMGRKLKVYAGPDHPHRAQNPRLIQMEN